MKRAREAGFVDWRTKIVLNWQRHVDGYRIEREGEGRRAPLTNLDGAIEEAIADPERLYIVANGGEQRHYTAKAWKEDILFDLANTFAYAPSDGVIAKRVLAFVKQWGLLGYSRSEQPLAEFLEMAANMSGASEVGEGGSHSSRSRAAACPCHSRGR